jgi:hypothetical protein
MNIMTALVQWYNFLHLALSVSEHQNGKEANQISTMAYVNGYGNRIRELPFPVVIVGSKYDLFKNEERYYH